MNGPTIFSAGPARNRTGGTSIAVATTRAYRAVREGEYYSSGFFTEGQELNAGRIVRTYDGGRNWIEQDSSTTADLFSVSFYKNRGYAIGRDGMVLRYYDKR